MTLPIEIQREVMLETTRLLWGLYNLRKSNWLTDHPKATLDAIAASCRKIADELGL